MAINDYKRSSVKVINPYTFVPIAPQKVNGKKRDELPNAKDYYQNQAELHTGVLHCTLQVETPLAIPDTEKVRGDIEVKEHKVYPFYKDREKYTIPGSSLRGVIRSVYETVTDSCFVTVKNDMALSLRAEANNPYQPGVLILEKDEINGTYKYNLYDAKRMLLMIEGYSPVEESKNIKKYKMKIENGVRTISVGNESLKTGDKVWFKTENSKHYKDIRKKNERMLIWEDGIITDLISDGNAEKRDGYRLGLLFLGEPMGNRKHGESVFALKGGKLVKSWECPQDENGNRRLESHYEKLQETLDFYRDDAINKNYKKNNPQEEHRGYQGFEKLDPRNMSAFPNGVPVWYRKTNEGRVYLSYASIGRTMYEKSLNNLLGELNHCTDRNHLCDACLLFGMVGGSEKEEKGIGSRIRVTDAHVIGSPSVQKSVTLKELGMPRYSYLPFYATYVGSKNSNKKFPESYDDKEATIAGRKYYWNNEKARSDSSIYSVPNKDRDKTKRNVTIDLMKPGAEFQFDVYYDGIKDEQLEKLMWVLTFGQNKLPDQLEDNENLLCHKIGRGKSIGLGSVKIVVNAKEERTFDLEGDGYRVNCTEKSAIEIKKELPGVSAAAVRKVASLQPFAKEYSGISINYPNIVNQDGTEIPAFVQQKNNGLARHQWYSKNRNDRNEGQVLHKIMDKDQTLYQYYYNRDGNGRKRR